MRLASLNRGAWWTAWAVVALRFVDLTADPWTITSSGDLFTDEGWYAKAARNWVLFGRFDVPGDFTPFTHTFGLTALQIGAFEVFGTSLTVARLLTVVVSSLGFGALALALHGSQHRRWAGLILLTIAANIMQWTFGRLALADPIATAFSVAALAAWAHDRDSKAMLTLAMVLATAATLIKAFYFFTPATIATATLLDAWHRRRLRDSLGACALLAICFASLAAAYLTLRASQPQAWDQFTQINVSARWVDGPTTWLRNASMATAKMLVYSGALTLPLVAFVAVLRKRASAGPMLKDPWTTIFGLWLVLALLQMSVAAYHAPRYMMFAGIALPILAWPRTARAEDDRVTWPVHASLALFALLQVALAGRAVAAAPWQYSLSHAASSAALEVIGSSVREHGRAVVLGSGTAALAALYNERIIALDVFGLTGDRLCAQAVRLRPSALLLDERKERETATRARLLACPGVVGLSGERRWTFLHNYYEQGALVFERINYADP